ncbi:MAG: DNA-3-methyladenine glycosylase 2 family protein [Thermomicrobiales bacterium]|nr:MAG: DNA-3-methyladenine glycosylase 2 family protein [Thermomicrobiales bacterium]
MKRTLTIPAPFSLEATCGPVDWTRGRWPNEDWIDGELIWVGWEGDRVVHRRVYANGDGIVVRGDADPAFDAGWAAAKLGSDRHMPHPEDPVIARIAAASPGLRPHASGSLFAGLVDSIVGQSITVMAAAVVSSRIASQFHPGIELNGRIFWPFPRPEDLANADVSRLRRSGLTWRRAVALVAAGQAARDGVFEELTSASIDVQRDALLAFPLVGRWTAESALLWGIGEGDAFPMGDVALLRAARLAYDQPEMTMKELETISLGWTGHRGWASRLLWLELFGPARSYASAPV